MSVTADLEERVRFLRNAAPQAFDDFVVAFAKYADASTNYLLDTTVDLPVAQGRAWQCRKILTLLKETKRNG